MPETGPASEKACLSPWPHQMIAAKNGGARGMTAALFRSHLKTDQLLSLYQAVRATSRGLGARLSDADATPQSMPDASPAKWHLAHTTWFFEKMVLVPFLPDYRCFDETYNFLFNSYYNSIGARQPRPKRGLITPPQPRRCLSLSRTCRCRHCAPPRKIDTGSRDRAHRAWLSS